jgi:hypothetical protein
MEADRLKDAEAGAGLHLPTKLLSVFWTRPANSLIRLHLLICKGKAPIIRA